MAELDKKVDIAVDESTFGSWREKKGKSKAEKAQGIENEQEQARKQEDNEKWPEIKRLLHL